MKKVFLLMLTLSCFLFGCSSQKDVKEYPSDYPDSSGYGIDDIYYPDNSGQKILSSDIANVNYSHIDQGYVTASLNHKSEQKIKLLIRKGEKSYYYDLINQNPVAFPLQMGNGKYYLGIYENVEGDNYAMKKSLTLDVQIKDELSPFLYPNQLVDYQPGDKITSIAIDIVKKDKNDLQRIQNIYNYVVDNITYDDEKAVEATQKYLIPNLNNIIKNKTGICFDYALEEKYQFSNQMAMILKAGLSVQQGIEMMQQDLENQNLKIALEAILGYMKEDAHLSLAIERTGMFDDYMVHLLKVGEVSGHIDDVMESLGEYYLRMDDMTSQLQQALTYPIILFIMMFVVVGVVVFQVLPIFENVLMSLGSHLSSFASRFMNFGQIFSMLGFMILGIFMIMIISFYVYAKKSHQDIMVMFVQKSWITKKIANHMNHAQLTYALSLFVSSGYDLQEAVHYTIELVDNSQLQNQLKQCYHDLEQGVSFVDAVSQHQIYKGMKLNMIQIGFQTGQVDAVMKTLSNHYQDEVSQSIAHFLNIIEPAIVTFLSVIVGVVLLSVMLPLVSIMSSL